MSPFKSWWVVSDGKKYPRPEMFPTLVIASWIASNRVIAGGGTTHIVEYDAGKLTCCWPVRDEGAAEAVERVRQQLEQLERDKVIEPRGMEMGR